MRLTLKVGDAEASVELTQDPTQEASNGELEAKRTRETVSDLEQATYDEDVAKFALTLSLPERIRRLYDDAKRKYHLEVNQLRSENSDLTARLGTALGEAATLGLKLDAIESALEGIPNKEEAPYWVIDAAERAAGVSLSVVERIKRLRAEVENEQCPDGWNILQNHEREAWQLLYGGTVVAELEEDGLTPSDWVFTGAGGSAPRKAVQALLTAVRNTERRRASK